MLVWITGASDIIVLLKLILKITLKVYSTSILL
jgi:hypothetical protein